jgi:hypothetical protein
MQREKKNAQGACPYCQGWDFTEVSQRRPLQVVQKCCSCEKYLVLNQKTGARYPLDNPQDPQSSPHT